MDLSIPCNDEHVESVCLYPVMIATCRTDPESIAYLQVAITGNGLPGNFTQGGFDHQG
jgi:hypothetical protein